MITLNRIRIKQFRAYEDIDIEFRSSNGVILMSGDNGAGKSTLLNAICWCLYADTPFFAIEDTDEIVNMHAPINASAEVELTTNIEGKVYEFKRKANRGAKGGVLEVSFEDNGNWIPLDGISGQDAVKRLLPKDIRHLFFFNGEQIKGIFKPGEDNEHDLKTSIRKVSEIEIIDKAMKHLDSVQSLYLKEISKSNKSAKEIEKTQSNIEKTKLEIVHHEKTIDAHLVNINRLRDQVERLDKLIKSTEGAREQKQRLELLEAHLKDVEGRLIDAELNKTELFQQNYHRVLLQDEFTEYEAALSLAEAQNRIPPPISPEITRRILDQNKCICGRHIEAEQRSFIEDQHKEYEEKQALQYLTDGILTHSYVLENLDKSKYILTDILDSIVHLTQEKKDLQAAIGLIDEHLDKAALLEHENPEARRQDIRREIEIANSAKGRTTSLLENSKRELRLFEEHLKRIIDEDERTDDIEKRRQYTEFITKQLAEVKKNMEISIREKLIKSVSDIFFSILPNTEFSKIDIDSNYSVSLLTENNAVYSTSHLSTGQAKTLGLSLAYGLSKDMGYSAIPLLIDNLYGDISEGHFKEVTEMISTLSKKKQVLIMDLNAERTRSMFPPGCIAQEFRIRRLESEYKTLIEEQGV